MSFSDSSVRTATRVFNINDASNALGSHILFDDNYDTQISHLWGVSDTKPAAGAKAPLASEFYGNWGASAGKVACSRCHNPHGDGGLAPKITKLDNSSDQMCKDCHRDWAQNLPSGKLSHPIVNYNAAVVDHPDKFKPAIVNVNQGNIRKVGGNVSCTSCHSPHYADSNSLTPDSYTLKSNPLFTSGDGHMLRTDGPASSNKSTLCTSCHLYKRHGNPTKGQEDVGCLVCHSAHNYNGGEANYYVLRNSVTTTRFGTRTNAIYTPLTDAFLMNHQNGTGFCERCHGVSSAIPGHSVAVGGTEDRYLQNCKDCHKHNEATSDFSWKWSANSTLCGDCHGFPPYLDVPGDYKDVDTPGTKGGYGVMDGASDGSHSYFTSGYYKAESGTPHKSHAGGGEALGAYVEATDYKFFDGQDACTQTCHDLNAHKQIDTPASFRNIAWGALARGNVAPNSVNLSPSYTTTGNGSCSNLYCHSNGGKRTGDQAKVAGDFKFAPTAPVWNTGDADIIGNATECATFCHGNSTTSMATGAQAQYRNNSVSHIKHLAKGYACNVCHKLTAAVGSTTQVLNVARVAPNGTHVNGKPDVGFDTSNDFDSVAAGTQLNLVKVGSGDNGSGYTATTAVCNVYCHSDGKLPSPTYANVDWDVAASGACGTCHQYYSGGVPTGSGAALSVTHVKHLAIANVTCDDCHGSNAASGTHAGHVNTVVTLVSGSCTTCHGIDGSEVVPSWGQSMTNDYCIACHTGSARGVVKTMTAPNKEAAKTRGHNATVSYASGNLPGNKQCTSCHLTNIGNHVNVTDGDATHLQASAATCTTSCHGVGGSAVKDGIVTHIPSMSTACTACHDPHGDAAVANIYMIRSVSAAYGGTVAFSNRGNTADPINASATNSFDEDDDSSLVTHAETNADDLCATCHRDELNGGTVSHNNRDNTPSNSRHHQGETCMTASCHKGHTDATGAFAKGGGSLCSDCHGNPPTATDPRYATNGTAYGVHAKHTWKQLDDASEDRSDCNICHPGAGSYTLSHSNGGALNLAAGIQPLGGGNYSCGTLNSGLGCHLSDGTDGFWKDTAAYAGNGLRCTACHNNGNNDGVLANAAPNTGAHSKHILATKTCADCHNNGTAITDTTHINEPAQPNVELDNVVLADKAKADLGEGAVARSSMTFNQPAATYTCIGNIALGCHNSKTAPNWRTATNIACTACHVVTGSDTADPKSGLHNMTQAGVQKHDGSTVPINGCTVCHGGTKPSSHANGTWQADQAGNTESRFLNAGMNYDDTGGANMGSCWDNGGAFLNYNAGAGCHRDNGVWKRLWSQEADSTATTPGSARCKVCHGQYLNLNSNQGGGWNENTSHNLTYGGRSSVRGETHNSRTLGDASACEDCHSFPSIGNHENGSLTMNDGGATNVNDADPTYPTRVYCQACHVTGDPLVANTFTLTKSTAFAKESVIGNYDPISQCNSCHGVGGGGRYWPVAANGDANTRNHGGRHEIHMARLATKVYGETVVQLLTNNTAQNPSLTSDTKQKNLCEYCHAAPAGGAGHHNEALPAEVAIANLWNKAADTGATYSSNQHGAGGADTCAGVNCHNNKLTVDNSYGWYDAVTGAGCVVCHTVGGTNDLPNNNIHPNSGLHNITPTVSGVRHDDTFSVSGACGSCHTGIAGAMVGSTHVNGAAAADAANNTDRGLFAAYTDAAANSGTCFGTGVDNSSNCHADGGSWKRRWSTTASSSNGIDECANCHGTFTAGWRWDNPAPAGTTDHSDPSALNPNGDTMGVAGKHPDCQICHGWGKPGYDTAWHNKTVGATPGHGDGRITMNGPDDTPGPGAGAKYDDATWGCAAACHSATWVLSDSGLTPNYGDYGAGSCFGCHGNGTDQYWPDGSGGSPAYVDDNANSASRHNTHVEAISLYKWGQTLAQLKADVASDSKQKAICAFCHGVNPGADGHGSDSGDQRVDVAGAGAFRKFAGSTTDALDTGAGAYASATRSCSNLVCHNLVTTPTVAADTWEGTTAANCTTLCHGPNTTATAREGHQKHVVTKAYACTQCHPNNGTNYKHVDGTVTLNFLVTGSLEQTYGSATAASYSDGSFAYDRTTPTGYCLNIYCHVDKQTPPWNGAINTGTTGCVDCHTVGAAGNNPSTGLHDVTPRITGKQHSNSFTYNGGASTAYCATCHTTTPSTGHVDGTFTTSWNAAPPSINFAAGVGFTDGATPTCGATATGCHKDAGAWKRKWHENATANTGLECAGCHGDWTRTWNTGVTHRTDAGPTNSHPAGTSYKCKDCHALESTAYSSLTWGGNHGNGQISMNNNATSFARGTGGDAGLSGCATSCHVAFDGTAAGQHSFTSTTARWATVQLLNGDPIDAGCNGCHGNTSVGVGQYWPDGTVNKAQYAYADDNTTVAVNHTAHVTAIASKRYSENLTQLLTDNTAGNPALKSSDKQKAICAYCHPNPGVGGHTTDAAPASRVDVNNTDSDNDGTPDVNVAYKFKKIIGGGDDNSPPSGGYYRFAATDKTCSNIACHANAKYTPGWYGDTVAPAAISDLAPSANTEPGTVKLTWTAPGDDNGDDGTAYVYDVRYRAVASGAISAANWTDANTKQAGNPPTVDYRSKQQTMIVKGLTPGTQYTFAVKTADERYPNAAAWSAISNVTSAFTAKTDDVAPIFSGVNTVRSGDGGDLFIDWDAGRDHSHGLSTPILYKVWYGNYSLKAHEANSGTMPTAAMTCYDKDTTPPTVATCDTTNEDYRISYVTTTALKYRATTGIKLGNVYYARVKAAHNDGNYTDTNTNEVMALAKSPAKVVSSIGNYKANGANSLGASYATPQTNITWSTGTSYKWYRDTAYPVDTNVSGISFEVYVADSGKNTGLQFQYQLGYGNGTTFTALPGTTGTMTVGKSSKRVRKIPLNGFSGMVPAGQRLCVQLTNNGSASLILAYGDTTNKGLLLVNEQRYNHRPTTTNATVNAAVSGSPTPGVVSVTWTGYADALDGDPIHYDIYGSTAVTPDYRYVIATGVCYDGTTYDPDCTPASGDETTTGIKWDTIADGISGSQTATRVRVAVGDGYLQDNNSLQPHYTADSSTFAVNNSTDGWPPAVIGSNDNGPGTADDTDDDLKAETRPKQGSVNLTWRAVGNDGFNHGTRASVYDIRYRAMSDGIISDANWNDANTKQAEGEPRPNFSGEMEGFELLGLNPEMLYSIAMKVGDEAGNYAVGISNVVTNATAGPKCGICHSTPPNDAATAGKHANHGYTMRECGYCHTTAAETFATDHQDGVISLGFKTATPATPTTGVGTIVYNQGAVKIYEDTSGVGGFNASGATQVDNGTCFGFSALGISGCHGPATPSWDTSTPSLACSACHGLSTRTTDEFYTGREYDANIVAGVTQAIKDQIKASPRKDNRGQDTGRYVGAHLKHLNSSFRLSKGDNCQLCHKDNVHYDGDAKVSYDVAVTGTGAQWDADGDGGVHNPNGGGTCAGTSETNCHGSNIPEWHSAATVACNQCHGFNGANPSHIKDLSTDRACTYCHPAGHPQGTLQDPNSIMIPNNVTVGINYRSGGIHLLKAIGGRTALNDATAINGEAEICWGCHEDNSISEWGTNSKANTGSMVYNYGTINKTKWSSATWTSAAAMFAYKTGTIKSTHTANTAGSSAVTGTTYSMSEAPDDDDLIRCSYCHDVHNMNKAPGDGVAGTVGTPYLRGTWKGNPYKEDGAPRASSTYTNVVVGTAGFGAIPRGGTGYTANGGYFIDQNSGDPTSGWALSDSAGLCVLCHTDNVDTMDQKTGENLWLGTNGHSNSALGGQSLVGTKADIFNYTQRNGATSPLTYTGNGTDAGNPSMGYQNAADYSTTVYGYGFRSTEGEGWARTPAVYDPGRPYSFNAFNWGVTQDNGTIDSFYHNFSCSKCHNPHASRLPKLMITNCLDTQHNKWDDVATLLLPASGTANTAGTDTLSTANGAKRASNWSSAQNCHRYGDPAQSGLGGGWNKVTPWPLSQDTVP